MSDKDRENKLNQMIAKLMIAEFLGQVNNDGPALTAKEARELDRIVAGLQDLSGYIKDLLSENATSEDITNALNTRFGLNKWEQGSVANLMLLGNELGQLGYGTSGIFIAFLVGMEAGHRDMSKEQHEVADRRWDELVPADDMEEHEDDRHIDMQDDSTIEVQEKQTQQEAINLTRSIIGQPNKKMV